MTVDKMKKEDLELLSNKDITNLILEESKKPLNTADLFKKIIKLLDLPDETFENKIGDFYTSVSTDKRFVLLENGCWDLRNRYTSDKVIKTAIEEDDDEIDENEEDSITEDDNMEDDYSDNDDDSYNSDSEDDLKDLVILDEDEMELEE